MRALVGICTLVTLFIAAIGPRQALASGKSKRPELRGRGPQGETAASPAHHAFPEGPSLYGFLRMAKAPLHPDSGHSLANLSSVGVASHIERALTDSGLFVLTSITPGVASKGWKPSVWAVGALPKDGTQGPSTHILHVKIVPGIETGHTIAHWKNLSGKTPRNHVLVSDALGNMMAAGPEGKTHRDDPSFILPAFIAISNEKTGGVVRFAITDSGELGGWIGNRRTAGAVPQKRPPVVPMTSFDLVGIAPFGEEAVVPMNYGRSILDWAKSTF